ncbi:TPA: HNH endonuclease [Burkholderia multivorans]|uniref:HNH endonuclease n=1 Tax=Burkholderia multivorans TaxID=87883 RepID=UPI000CFFDF87|nr:HNH endonuclease [Burkholderia multivorans]PRD74819.1 Fis family transcriptional regulator [Burkholderia multivorans]
MKSELTAERARELLDYDPETGEFRWKVRRGKQRPGLLAGSVDAKGYVTIRIDYKLLFAHRVAWLIVTGEWPIFQIDHRDGDKSNNRFANLRTATNSQNQANIGLRAHNTSGIKGVSWSREKQKWEARFRCENRQYFVGYFNDIREARVAYQCAIEKYFGEYARAA